MIASGPGISDSSTKEDAFAIVKKYHLILTDHANELLRQETPKVLTNVETVITGSVRGTMPCRRKKQPVIAGMKRYFSPIIWIVRRRETGALFGDIA